MSNETFSGTTKNIKTTRQAVRGVQIGSKFQLVYGPKKTRTTQKKTNVTNATNDAYVPTTLNSFDVLSNMVDVDEEMGTITRGESCGG
jgi:GTPase Era involved in 16S rRNA processing